MPLTDHQILHLNSLLQDFQDAYLASTEDNRKLQILKKYSEADWDTLLDKAIKFIQWHIDKNKWPESSIDDPHELHDYVEKYLDWNIL